MSDKARMHIVGGGLSGLAAGLSLTAAGHPVTLYEATGHGGGRCRSYHDPELDCLVDNGNHLILSANDHALAYVDEIGAVDELTPADAPPVFPFVDLQSGARWSIAPNEGPVPWWIFARSRRVPGVGAWQHFHGTGIIRAKPHHTVADFVSADHPLYAAFWEPFTLAVMNTPVEQASAISLKRALMKSFARGGQALKPRIARKGLGPALIDPAFDTLRKRGAEIRFQSRIHAIEWDAGNRVSALTLADGAALPVLEGEGVIIALPPEHAHALLPDLQTPEGAAPIANAHFRLPTMPFDDAEPHLLGVLGGASQWIFVRGDVASVTISAAFDVDREPKAALLSRLWSEVARALDLGETNQPPGRIVRERRATFLQTPENEKRRPRSHHLRGNVFLAGDWMDTHLPACIDGAVLSGRRAAEHALRLAAQHSLH